MSPDTLKKHLDDGAKLVFAKRPGKEGSLRACYAIEFGRRHGYRVTEQSVKQLRCTLENEGGLLLLLLKNDKASPLPPFGEEPLHAFPEGMEEEAVYQTLPRYDFTMQVQAQRLLKKIGFF